MHLDLFVFSVWGMWEYKFNTKQTLYYPAILGEQDYLFKHIYLQLDNNR